jgi:hypothetical protein
LLLRAYGKPVPFSYAATTEGCTFLLDEDGVCLQVLLGGARRGVSETTLGGRTRAEAAQRCVGAQYVASIDVRIDGALVPMPRVGMPMLFAYTDDEGRIALVRTGDLVRFETLNPQEHEEIPIDWIDDVDDECLTIPLQESGERRTPIVTLFDDIHRYARAPAKTHPPRPPPPRPAQRSVPVRIRKVQVGPRDSAPTLEWMNPARRGAPKRAGGG